MEDKGKDRLWLGLVCAVLVIVWSLVFALQFFTRKPIPVSVENDVTQAPEITDMAGNHPGTIEQKNEPEKDIAVTPTEIPVPTEPETVWTRLFGKNVPELAAEQGKYSIVLPKSGAASVRYEEEQIYRRLRIILENAAITEDMVARVSGDSLYKGIPEVEEPVIPEELKNVPLVREPKTEEEDTVRKINIIEKNGNTTAELELNSVYETQITEDEEYIYITLIRPFELYDRIIVLDAGHGGYDPGTSGGGTTEASVNLKVIRYLKELLDEREDIKVYYTRLDDTLPDLSTRVEFANALHADFLISVHCNYNPASSIHGIEVMYSRLQVVDDTFSSRILAEKCLDYVSRETGMAERYLNERSENLHLMKYCTMPCALVEFGFMSNKTDLALLTAEKTQRACARAIYRVIDEHYQKSEEKSE